MKNINQFFILFVSSILIILLFSNISYSQLSKETVFKSLEEKYSKVKSVSFQYSMKELLENKGTIKANSENKYYITLIDRILICNSKTIWNISEKDKKVIISTYEESNKDEISYSNFFFKFFELYTPNSLTKDISSKDNDYYTMVLVPVKDFQSEIKADKIKLTLDTKTLDIKSIKFFKGKETQTFKISKLKLNPKLKKTLFDFKAPEDWDVIDLR